MRIVIRTSDLLITEEFVLDRPITVDLPNLRTLHIRQGEHETAKLDNLTLITVGFGVGCFHALVNCFSTYYAPRQWRVAGLS